MILLLDLGNSRIKWALAEQGELIVSGAAAKISELAAAWADMATPRRVSGCCVAGEQTRCEIETEVASRWGLVVDWLQPVAVQMGVRNHYANPASLGADRWAALLGARSCFPGTALVVVSAGTALVVDVLTAEGDYPGGMILPGYQLMKTALASGTAQLPLASGTFVPFPVNTADAIETGCLSAMLGAILAMANRLAGAGQMGVRIILSGGNANALAILLGSQAQVVDNLALLGLAALTIEEVTAR